MLGQPLTVREWHHPILFALPHRHRPLARGQVASPVPGEGQVIVAPAGDSTRDGSTEDSRHELCELAGERRLIDIGDQASKRGRDGRYGFAIYVREPIER